MPRPTPAPTTALGAAIQYRRGPCTQATAAADVGVAGVTLSRLERGLHQPSPTTAAKLARWLRMDLESVFLAAISAPEPFATPAPGESR